MKKIFFVLLLQFLFLFLIGTSPAKACVCNIVSATNLTPVVAPNSPPCPSNSVATCSVSGGSIANLSVSCNCVVSNPGVNCSTNSIPQYGQTCCVNYYVGPGGYCIPNGVNPYQIPTSVPNTSNDVHGDCGETKIDTAIGCIPVLNSDGGKSFMTFILRWATGIGGGIAFLLILYGGFIIMTSTGNPERLKAGQELLTSAISGLVLLIFSIFVLNFIGINILGIFK